MTADLAFHWYSNRLTQKHILFYLTLPDRSALQSFTVRCAAVAARIEDPYIDTTMKV